MCNIQRPVKPSSHKKVEEIRVRDLENTVEITRHRAEHVKSKMLLSIDKEESQYLRKAGYSR